MFHNIRVGKYVLTFYTAKDRSNSENIESIESITR